MENIEKTVLQKTTLDKNKNTKGKEQSKKYAYSSNKQNNQVSPKNTNKVFNENETSKELDESKKLAGALLDKSTSSKNKNPNDIEKEKKELASIKQDHKNKNIDLDDLGDFDDITEEEWLDEEELEERKKLAAAMLDKFVNNKSQLSEHEKYILSRIKYEDKTNEKLASQNVDREPLDKVKINNKHCCIHSEDFQKAQELSLKNNYVEDFETLEQKNEEWTTGENDSEIQNNTELNNEEKNSDNELTKINSSENNEDNLSEDDLEIIAKEQFKNPKNEKIKKNNSHLDDDEDEEIEDDDFEEEDDEWVDEEGEEDKKIKPDKSRDKRKLESKHKKEEILVKRIDLSDLDDFEDKSNETNQKDFSSYDNKNEKIKSKRSLILLVIKT